MTATLSVCCMANSPGPFLKAALAPVREIADEVVVAVGGSVSEADLSCYEELADRLYSIDFQFVERHLAWLHAQCRGDWILRFDGDEIPTAEMVREVAAAIEDRQLSSVLFARRNLFPTIETYIAQEPWYPDFQVRLVRNDGSLRFSGLTHSSAERAMPARAVEAPMYHLPFILSDVEDRRARAVRYERLRSGLVAPTGLPANDALLPESLSSLLTAPVPAEHLTQIEAVLAQSDAVVAESQREKAAVRAVPVSLDETDAFWANRVMPESAYRATIEAIGAPVALAPGEIRPFYFRVRNEGSETWGWDPSIGPFVHVVHRLLDERRTPVGEWRPSFFTEWVKPGGTTIVPAHVQAPAVAGRYRLEVKIRHSPEQRLFGRAAEIELVIRPGGAWSVGGERDERAV